VIEQAAMRTDTQHIGVRDLEEVLRQSGIKQIAPRMPAVDAGAMPVAAAQALRPLAEQVAEVERRAIEAALAATKGNKLAAAKLLGISRAKLYERLESLTDIQAMPENRSANLSRFKAIRPWAEENPF